MKTISNFLQPLRGIGILVTAINKIQLFPTQLTSIHGDLCQVRIVKSCVYGVIVMGLHKYDFYLFNKNKAHAN